MKKILLILIGIVCPLLTFAQITGTIVDAQTGDIMIALARSLSDGKSVVSFDLSLKMIQEG